MFGFFVNSALFTDPQISLFSNFSLKMGLTVLFTHLKIILLQCFSVFNFQFSAFNCIQTDPKT